MLGQWPDAWTHLVLLQVWPWQQEHIFFHGKTCESSDFFFEALVLKERVMIARAKHWRLGTFSWSSLVSRRNFLLQYIYFCSSPLPVPQIYHHCQQHQRKVNITIGEKAEAREKGEELQVLQERKLGRDTLVETLDEACGVVCGGRGR